MTSSPVGLYGSADAVQKSMGGLVGVALVTEWRQSETRSALVVCSENKDSN